MRMISNSTYSPFSFYPLDFVDSLFGSSDEISTKRKTYSKYWTLAWDKEGKKEVTVLVPGLKRSDIVVEAEENNIVVKFTPYREKTEKTYAFYLDGLDTSNVEAALEDGVLKVTAKRLDSSPNRKTVEIK